MLGQAVAVLDGVAAGSDAVLQTLATEGVAGRLLARAMGLVHQRLQHGQRIRQDVLRFASGVEGIAAGRIELDPVHAPVDVLAHGRARFLGRANDDAGERIRLGRRVRRLRRPTRFPRPATWSRGPSMSPMLMASRMSTSPYPLPCDPMSRMAVKPARKSACALLMAMSAERSFVIFGRRLL